MKKILSKWKLLLSIFLFACIVSIALANYLILKTTDALVYDAVENIPYHKTALLLGTSKHLKSGRVNRYFQYRIDAALALYKAGKIDYIIVSGDNGVEHYNEPEDMKNDLIAGGIPEERIYLDYAGFRTLDSVVRMEKIFGQHDFTIISQEFHNRRAIFIARQQGYEVVGLNAKDVSTAYGFRTQMREKLARVKVFVDLLFHKQPKFLGDPVNVPA